MKLGIIYYNFPGYSFTDFLRYASETGYGYIEIFASNVWRSGVDDPEREAGKMRKEIESFGLKVSALSGENDFIVLEEEVIKAQVARMGRVCKLANILGAEVIRTEGGSPKDSVPKERWVEAMAGCLTRCIDFAEKNNVRFAVDNHGHVTNDGELQVELFKRVGSDRVGANMDTMNYRWAGHSLEKVAYFHKIVAPYAFHTHMKDGTGSLREYNCKPLGEGEIDLKYAVKCLKNAGYDGVWCAEYEGGDGAAGYTRCYKWLKANL